MIADVVISKYVSFNWVIKLKSAMHGGSGAGGGGAVSGSIIHSGQYSYTQLNVMGVDNKLGWIQ
jgi:hypothetical protein